MNVYVDWVVVFQIFCIVQGITTSIYLIIHKSKRPGQLWLGLLLLGLTCQVIDYFLSRSGIYYRNRWLYFSPLFYSWSFGFCLYFYVQSVYQKPLRLKSWHFLPVFMQAAFYLVLAFQNLDFKAWFWINIHKPYTRYLDYYGTCFLLFGYLALSLNLVRKNNYKPVWLSRFLFGLLLFYVAAMLDPLFNHLYLSPTAPKFYLTAWVLPIFMYWLALVALIKQEVNQRHKQQAAYLNVDPNHLELIKTKVKVNQLYKDPDLTLPELARLVGLRTNEVSYLINTGLSKSFNDFLNDYRLEEVKQRLHAGDDEKLTLLGIAFEAGFRSKTTFNRVFKERTGLSPKAYKNNSRSTQRNDSFIDNR
jgi:AraC-like DNA-binding protein